MTQPYACTAEVSFLKAPKGSSFVVGTLTLRVNTPAEGGAVRAQESCFVVGSDPEVPILLIGCPEEVAGRVL